MTYDEFADKHQLELKYQKVDSRPDRSTSEWDKTARHYVCTLSQVGRGNPKTFTFCYSMGRGIKHGPKVGDILESLALDCDTDLLDESLQEMNYREGKRIFDACERTREGLTDMLGAKLLDSLIACVEIND